MDIKPGETGKMELPVGKPMSFNHNKPVTYKVITVGGSVMEVLLPGGVDLNVLNAGDLASVILTINDSPTGPTEIV